MTLSVSASRWAFLDRRLSCTCFSASAAAALSSLAFRSSASASDSAVVARRQVVDTRRAGTAPKDEADGISRDNRNVAAESCMGRIVIV